MSRKSRVAKMYENLTAIERAGIAIRWVKRGEKADEVVKSSMPEEQVEEYNYAIGLFLGVNLAVWGRIHACRLKARVIAERLSWLECMWLWGAEVHALRYAMAHARRAGIEPPPEVAAFVEESLATAPDAMVTALMRPTDALGQLAKEENRSPGDALMLRLVDGVVEDVRDAWAEARTLAFVVSTVQVRLGGECPLWPALRSSLDACVQELEGIRQDLEKYVGQVEVGGPDSRSCGDLCDLVETLGQVFSGQRPAEDDS